jgi:hypothetical protein
MTDVARAWPKACFPPFPVHVEEARWVMHFEIEPLPSRS